MVYKPADKSGDEDWTRLASKWQQLYGRAPSASADAGKLLREIRSADPEWASAAVNYINFFGFAPSAQPAAKLMRDVRANEKLGGPPGQRLDLAEIRSALAAISARFQLQRGALNAERGATNSASKRALEDIDRESGDALSSFRSAAAGTGLLRSGLAVRDVGDIASGFARTRADTVSKRDNALRAIQSNLSTLRSQETAARASTARELATKQVGTKEAIARALRLV